MIEAFVSIGSNIAPADNVRRAVELLAAATPVTGISTVYLTPAEGRPEQPPYYNCVVRIRTDLPPVEVKAQVLAPIERALGRVRSDDKFASRTIDLDLIVYGVEELDTESLRLPDPHILTRWFLAAPLAELAPDLVLPRWDLPISQLAACLPADQMVPLLEYTRQLRSMVEAAGP